MKFQKIQKIAPPKTETPETTQLTSRPFAPITQHPTATPTPIGQQEQTKGLLQRKRNLLEIPSLMAAPKKAIQKKLTIGEPGDKYKQEADETARQVVQRIHQLKSDQLQRIELSKEKLQPQLDTNIIGREKIQQFILQSKRVAQAKLNLVQRAPHPYPQIYDKWHSKDKIYGLSDSQRKVGRDIEQKPGTEEDPILMNFLFKKFLGTKRMEFDGLLQGTQEYEKNALQDISLDEQTQDAAAARFKKFLDNHPNFNPDQDFQGKPLSDKDRTFFRIKKASKLGLEWTIKEEGGEIYFILDNINLKKIIEKSGPRESHPDLKEGKYHPKTGDNMRNITGSELRYLYRHRNDKQMMDKVSFWKDERQVPPPWETDKELWNEYKPKSED